MPPTPETVLSADAATRLLHDYVPLLGHIGLCVERIEPDAVTVAAPLAANANHHGSAFGGSLSLIGIVAGWLLAYAGQPGLVRTRNIVVADSRTDFLRPHRDRLVARAGWEPADALAYRTALNEGRRAQVDITIDLGTEDRPTMRQRNRYVAVPE